MTRSDASIPTENRPSFLGSLMVFVVYALIVCAAIALLRTRGAMAAGSELSVPRTVFTVANAASLTGFQQTVTVDSYKRFGQGVILVLMLAGSLASMIIGAAAVVRLLRLPWSMMRITLWAIGVEAVAVALGTLALVGGERDLFEAFFQATSAFGNCGVVIGAVHSMHDLLFHVAILPLSVLGGIGLPVIMEVFDRLRAGRCTSLHTRAALGMTAGVYFIGMLVLLWLMWPGEVAEGASRAAGAGNAAVRSSTAALNARTLGWPVDTPATWPREGVWVLMLLMLIGGSPAGTAGGLKTTTLFELGRGTWGALRGRPISRVFGFTIVWVALYFLVVLITTMRLVSTEPALAADHALLLAISAVSNVGLAYAPVSITGPGMFTLSASMLVGRILPLVILWWAALTTRDAEVAVG